uniref:hypothetical protein n=1 Tax=Lactobacillus acidophilus TaxID=1579 RepID=UPI003F54F6F7
MSKSKLFSKIMGVVGSIAIMGLSATCLTQHQQINQLNHENVVNADKVKSERLKVGTRYNIGKNVSMIISEYKTNNKNNIVITTNLKHKDFYNVGANEDKNGKTDGVTVAFGADQR